MRAYKGTYVGKGSALAEAIEKGDAEAKKVYDETTQRFDAMYSQEDRTWFYTKHKE